MRIKINQPITPVSPTVYPYLGIHTNDVNRPDPMIVWFLSPDNGILMSKNDNSPANLYSRDEVWNEDSFVLFKGSITLNNDED